MIKGVRCLLSLCAGALFLTVGCAGGEKREKAEDTVELKLGESYAIEGTEMTLQIEEAYETEELSPADPSGYFYYYEDKEGYHYYVVSAKLINPARLAVKPADFEAVASKGRKKYETKVVLEASSGAMFLREDEETVGEEPTLHLLVLVEDGKDAPDTVELYYNNGLAEKKEDELWDRGVRIDLSYF